MAITYENSIKDITIEQCWWLYTDGTSVVFDEGKHVTMSIEDEN